MTRLPDQEYHPVVFKSICRIIRLYIIIARFTSDLIPPPCLGFLLDVILKSTLVNMFCFENQSSQ